MAGVLGRATQEDGFLDGQVLPVLLLPREVRCVVHGDDSVFSGPTPQLAWVKGKVARRFLVKTMQIFAGGPDDQREIRILNRVVRWELGGLTYESDPLHAEILRQSLCGTDRSVSVLGSRPIFMGKEDDDKLSAHKAGLFNSCTARANSLSLDRPDFAYATKELCRRMRAPTRHDLQIMRRVARYLNVIYQLEWQRWPDLRTFVGRFRGMFGHPPQHIRRLHFFTARTS